jgi:hypothetical protein
MKTNFQTMSKTELKNYILEHRDDQEAFYAYMDQLANEPVLAVHSLSDSEPLTDVINRVKKKAA